MSRGGDISEWEGFYQRGVFLNGRFSRCPHPGLLEIQAVKPGVVRIRGAQSGRFLCLDAGGRPRGEVSVGGETPKRPSFNPPPSIFITPPPPIPPPETLPL